MDPKKGMMASTTASFTVGGDYLFPSFAAFYMYWKNTFVACPLLSLVVSSGSLITDIALTSAY